MLSLEEKQVMQKALEAFDEGKTIGIPHAEVYIRELLEDNRALEQMAKKASDELKEAKWLVGDLNERLTDKKNDSPF